jgi:hypothetical protein
MRDHMHIRRLLLITASLALFFVLGGTALAAKQYLLKRPSHEHCKSHYVKKAETVKKHEGGRTVKVHEIFCVFVAPRVPTAVAPTPTTAPATTPGTTPVTTPTTPAPVVVPPIVKETPPAIKETPPVEKPVGPVTTTTTLTVSPPEDCKLESIGGGIGTVNSCLYAVSATVKASGTPLPSAPIVFVFTNPGEPGKEWTVSGVSAFELQAQKESVSTTHATSVFIPHGPLIASISGEEPWSITATYAGATGFDASGLTP